MYFNIMIFIAIILISLNSLAILFCSFMIKRIDKVYTYRSFLLEILMQKGYLDIAKGLNPDWRFNKYEEVTFNEMVVKFWKKLDSFYEDKSFLQ